MAGMSCWVQSGRHELIDGCALVREGLASRALLSDLECESVLARGEPDRQHSVEFALDLGLELVNLLFAQLECEVEDSCSVGLRSLEADGEVSVPVVVVIQHAITSRCPALPGSTCGARCAGEKAHTSHKAPQDVRLALVVGSNEDREVAKPDLLGLLDTPVALQREFDDLHLITLDGEVATVADPAG